MAEKKNNTKLAAGIRNLMANGCAGTSAKSKMGDSIQKKTSDPDTNTPTPPDVRTSGEQDIQTSVVTEIHPDVSTSGEQDSSTSMEQDIKNSVDKDVMTSVEPDVNISGNHAKTSKSKKGIHVKRARDKDSNSSGHHDVKRSRIVESDGIVRKPINITMRVSYFKKIRREAVDRDIEAWQLLDDILTSYFGK